MIQNQSTDEDKHMTFESEKELLDYLEQHAYSAAFSDVMDEMGYREQAVSPDRRIRPLCEHFVSAGRAVTLLNAPDTDEKDPYDLVIKCIDSLSPETVLVTTGKVPLTTGIMGELTATALRVKGCRGAIVNGYTRDVRKLIKMGYPTFAWGASPIDTTGRVRVVEYNIPITIGGATISPGDLVFADLDGVMVIPHAAEQEIIAKVLERIGTENIVRKELAEGRRMSDVWSRYGVL
jgi:regulator of RNase E activity RraA